MKRLFPVVLLEIFVYDNIKNHLLRLNRGEGHLKVTIYPEQDTQLLPGI